MVKVTKQQAAENRAAVVKAAGRLFRAHGFDGVGVADITRAAGLTHGGFYGQFASKDALAAEACGQAFAESLALLRARLDRPGGDLLRYVDSYLSERHRDQPRRRLPDGGLRAPRSRTRTGRCRTNSPRVSAVSSTPSRRGFLSPRTTRASTAAARSTIVAALVGGMTLARATARSSPELSAEILASVRAQIADLALPEDRAASTG